MFVIPPCLFSRKVVITFVGTQLAGAAITAHCDDLSSGCFLFVCFRDAVSLFWHAATVHYYSVKRLIPLLQTSPLA